MTERSQRTHFPVLQGQGTRVEVEDDLCVDEDDLKDNSQKLELPRVCKPIEPPHQTTRNVQPGPFGAYKN